MVSTTWTSTPSHAVNKEVSVSWYRSRLMTFADAGPVAIAAMTIPTAVAARTLASMGILLGRAHPLSQLRQSQYAAPQRSACAPWSPRYGARDVNREAHGAQSGTQNWHAPASLRTRLA